MLVKHKLKFELNEIMSPVNNNNNIFSINYFFCLGVILPSFESFNDGGDSKIRI